MEHFRQSMLDLIIETSTNLPDDVREAMAARIHEESPGSRAAVALATITKNIDMACENTGPICQDTGMPTFVVYTPVGTNQIAMHADIAWALAEATRLGKLRPNAVDPLTGKNSGNNLGDGVPVIHWEQWEKDEIEVRLILKGGGCENKNIQYSLPADLDHLGKAGRNLEGIRKCILHAVWKAQGQGCAAGFLGVGIGGDRTSSYACAKEQLFRDCRDVNPDPELAKLESYIVEKANTLNIGTMGFGGNVTLLGCKIGKYHRLPASFFVSVAYDCWAYRRQIVSIDPASGAITGWRFRAEKPAPMAAGEGIPRTGREITLTPPISEEQIRSLKVGDVVLITGAIFTGRDALHQYLMDHDAPVNMNGGVLYHCGPVMIKDENGKWQVKAAGPTTSIREEPYQAEIIKKFGIRAVIGKGGMGAKTLAGLKEHGAVYLNAIGGAAQYYAESLVDVKNVYFLEEFGVPEAMWVYEAKEFPAIVTMDANGNSLHREIEEDSAKRLEKLRLDALQ